MFITLYNPGVNVEHVKIVLDVPVLLIVIIEEEPLFNDPESIVILYANDIVNCTVDVVNCCPKNNNNFGLVYVV